MHIELPIYGVCCHECEVPLDDGELRMKKVHGGPLEIFADLEEALECIQEDVGGTWNPGIRTGRVLEQVANQVSWPLKGHLYGLRNQSIVCYYCDRSLCSTCFLTTSVDLV